jgi:hypothetical protein
MNNGTGPVLRRAVCAALAALALLSGALLSGCGRDEPRTDGGPPQIRRLTEAQYRQIIADLFGPDIKIAGRFDPLARTAGLLEVGAAKAAITPSGFEHYDAMARAVAEQVVDEAHREILVPCLPTSAAGPDAACAKAFFQAVGPRLYRRPLDARDLDAAVDVAGRTAQRVGDFYVGLASGLAGMLEAPDFLFVADSTEPDPGHPGKLRLDAYSKASRLSFLLWDTAPDAELLAAAASSALQTREGLAHEVDRMIASPRLVQGVRAFFADTLAFDTFDTLAKDSLIYPAFTQSVGDAAQEQTLRTITDLLLTRDGDYRDLFTTRRTFLDRSLGLIYDVPVDNPNGWVPYEFPEGDAHAGIVGEISFVALHSHPGRSSATLRGKAVREILLCQRVPDPPGNVDFSLVQDTKNPKFRTARQRLTAHRSQPTCAGCHKIMDPIGLALENFDGAGQLRADENGAPIDASGEIDGTPFNGAAALGKVLHDDPATASCLVNRVYAYGLGRTPTQGEAAWMKYLTEKFAADGYRLRALLRRIATSDAFYAIGGAASPPGSTTASGNDKPTAGGRS